MTFQRRLNRKYGWVWIFALCALAQQARAQLPPAPPIHKLVITNIGPQTVSESLVRANIHVKQGDPYAKALIDDDIRNLFATGFFSDVRVTEESTPQGIDLTYYVQSKLKLVEINFVGNKKYSTHKLSKKLTSKIGDPIDERKLFMDTLEIKKMYQKSGYPQTEVKYIPHLDER